MQPRSVEDLTYLDIYRPVEDGVELKQFLDKTRHLGETVFGFEHMHTRVEEPMIMPNEEGVDEPALVSTPVQTPRITVYGGGELKLDLLDRRVLPQMNYASRFRWVAGQTIRRAADPTYNPIERSPEETTRRALLRESTSLSTRLREIGEAYGVTDQDDIQIVCDAVAMPVDPPLQHMGKELALIPRAEDKATQMLVDQAGVCLRALGFHSSKAANPYSPTILHIPFALMPADATPDEISEFVPGVKEGLPIHLRLRNFNDNVHAASWAPVPKK